jgi:hypothetical protein
VSQNGITGNFNAATGVLTLTGSATVANYQTALQSVAFNATGDAPTAGNRTLQIVVNDGTSNSTIATKTLAVTAVNDAPVVDVTATALSYLENAGELAVDTGLTVTDVDSANLSGATVTISGGFVTNEDSLVFDNQNGITGSYNTLSGELSLTGSASVANYQTALRSIRYKNVSDVPSTAARTIRFVVGDNGTENNTSSPKTRTINLTAVNDGPSLSTSSTGALAYTAGSTATVVDSLIAVNDAEQNNITGGTVTISSGYVNGSDLLAATNQNGITATFSAATGVLTLTGSATISQYQQILRTVTFHNAGAFTASSRTLTFHLVDDGSPVGQSNDLTRTINVESGGTAEGEGFFASLGNDQPANEENSNMSQDEFADNVDDFYALVGE